MYIIIILFIAIVQCQNQLVNPSDTDIGACSCDLNKGSCDVSCCCDKDCSTEIIKTFNCVSKANEDIKSISSKSAVQTTCFKDILIYRSNSPYVIQKKGDLVCIDHEQDSDSSYDQQLINPKIDSSVSSRSINIDNSISSPLGTPTTLSSIYQIGTSIFTYDNTTDTASYYSLPIKIFNSQICAGFAPITYLNDFTSTCLQPVNLETCLNALDTTKYVPEFCLITNPASLATNATNVSYTCCTANGSSSSWTAPTCSNALENLNLIIYYSNPTGIVNCSVSLNTVNSTSTVLQTLSVSFVEIGSATSSTAYSGNPGYLQGAPIIAGTSNGSSIAISDFTILQASSDGSCAATSDRTILFGQNVQSLCFFGSNTSSNCPTITNLTNILLPFSSPNLYVSAYGNPDPSNITGYWLPVTFCTSEIGSSAAPVCQTGSAPNSSLGQCYNRLDIQIAYANIGSITNPQPILGAVIFHYQRVTITSTTTLPTPVLITQSVTFQDISNSPATQGDQIPRPNTRIPGDFFYPFTLNRATNSISFSSIFYLLITYLLLLM